MMYYENTTCSDVIKEWDDGGIIWSIQLGGLGPGYEQAIQTMGVELLRVIVDESPDASEFDGDDEKWAAFRERVNNQTNHIASNLGLSGAQHGAAWNMAWVFYRQGPKAAVDLEQDRKIQVSKDFPSVDGNQVVSSGP